ncbi:unnamed protein product [Onchocerca flexuosa]|uniref:Uncharacterized protein n=1 Tax=Onchocerca flexuosa TaxID=387005 RepID=A0A183HQK4_9BILA|nr:unnamed protein product [Onchocerca flexuosa]
MSLLPMKNLSGSFPVLFIEARLQGPPEIVLSQMGISIDASDYNIALLSKFLVFIILEFLKLGKFEDQN